MSLADRIEKLAGEDNQVDVLIEVALFKPCLGWKACRANSAGTKVIYTDARDREHTYWAEEWTAPERRPTILAALREMEKRDGQQ